MSKVRTTVRECDRCAKETPADDSIEICYEDVTYVLDLCERHSGMLEMDLRGWLRLGREADVQHGPKTWVPGSLSRPKERPAERLVIPPHRREIVLDEPKPEILAPTNVDVTSHPEVVADHSPVRTHSAAEDMERLHVEWQEVVAAVKAPATVLPSKQRDDVNIHLTPDLSVLVTTNGGAVLGVARREHVEHLPHIPEPTRRRIERKGKRGGQGHVGPRTMDEVVAAVQATPGWSVEEGRRHYAVHGPNGERSTLPRSSSDWRGALNAVAELRSIGLDLREHARTAS